MFGLIDKLEKEECLEREEWITLLSACGDEKLRDYAAQKARTVAQGVFGTDIYVRGLIEFSNYCKNDCYYCGIRRSNPGADRYRLSMEDILVCCEEGWELGADPRDQTEISGMCHYVICGRENKRDISQMV